MHLNPFEFKHCSPSKDQLQRSNTMYDLFLCLAFLVAIVLPCIIAMTATLNKGSRLAIFEDDFSWLSGPPVLSLVAAEPELCPSAIVLSLD